MPKRRRFLGFYGLERLLRNNESILRNFRKVDDNQESSGGVMDIKR